jgi:hypothetical protein
MKKSYNLKELTPDNMKCGIGLCPGIYEEKCIVGSCPAIEEHKNRYLIIGKETGNREGEYDVVRVPTGILANVDRNRLRILKEESGETYIAGKRVDTRKLPPTLNELEKKVGKGEILISIPKDLIDNMKR